MATGIGIQLDSGGVVNRKTNSQMTFVFKQTGSDGPYSPIGYFENGGFSLWNGRAITYDRNNITVGAGQVVYGIPPEKGYSSRVGVTASIKYFTVSLGTAVNGTMSGGGTVWEDGSVQVTASPDVGCYLVSWSDGSQEGVGSTVPVTRTIPGEANITIYATFARMYVVSYTKNGGTGNAPSPAYVKPGESVVLADAKRFSYAGYTFDGWATSAGGDKVYDAGATITPSSDIKLYAHWLANFTVRFDANGGTGAMPDQYFTYGVAQVLTANSFKKDGWVFTGWNSRADGTGTAKADKADGSRLSSQSGATVTMYAQWRLPNVTIRRGNASEGGSSADSVGRITVTNQNGVKVAASDGGILRFEGYAGATYTVSCELRTEDAVAWELRGVMSGGEYVRQYSFTKGAGAVDLTYVFAEKTFYSVGTESDTAGCTVSVVTKPVKDGKFAAGSSIEFRAVADAGHELLSVSFFNVNNPSSRIPKGDDDSGNESFAFPNISCDLLASAHFKAKSVSVSAAKDGPSSWAILSVSAEKDGAVVSSVDYGSSVKFKAVLREGYEFDGWYLNGTKVGMYAEHTRTVTNPVSLVAKAKVKVRLRINYEDNRPAPGEYSRSCTISAMGLANVIGRDDLYVTLGESFSYSVGLGSVTEGSAEKWLFSGWTKVVSGRDTGEYFPLKESGSYTPVSAIDAMLKVRSYVAKNVISVLFVDSDDGSQIPPAGKNFIYSISPDGYVENRIDGMYRKIGYNGTKDVRLKFQPKVTHNDSEYFLDGVYSGDDLVSNANVVDLMLASDTGFVARYSKGGTRRITVAYGAGDRSMGEISVDENLPDESGTASSERERGETASISATPKNGYKFMGWYLDPDNIGGTPFVSSASARVTVSSDATYYAWFMLDTSSVCEWEGSANNKMMTWRSKVFVLPKPINPTCIRIDTEGYAVQKASVRMFSAPDKDATAVTELVNIADQTVRRLPIRRMERYLQVEVVNDAEVDAVYVGTSPGGLAV